MSSGAIRRAWAVSAEIVALVLLPAVIVVASSGCGPNAYRIPDAELQRLARLPADHRRGAHVRVQSWDTGGGQEAAAQVPVTATPPTPPPADPNWTNDLPPGQLATEPPPFVPDTEIVVDWPRPAPVVEIVGTRDNTAWESRAGSPPTTARMAPPVRGTPPPRPAGGAFPTPVPSVPIRGAPAARAIAANPVRGSIPARGSMPGSFGRGVQSGGARPIGSGTATPPRLPSHSAGRSGSRSGGGGGNGDAIVAGIVAVVVIAALVAAVASASEDAARPFDGWVAIEPVHPIHLRTHNRVERVVRLADLRVGDTIGVDLAFILSSEGKVVRLRDTADSSAPP
jgi:hypothetical protein